MNLLGLLTGILVVALTVYDFFNTTLSSNGAGFMTHRVSHLIWQSFLRISRISGKPQVLKSAGISVILTLIIMWLGLLWLGLFLILLGDYNSVVTAAKSLPASALDKLYYSGYVLSTMGNGDFKPGSTQWQLVTAVFSFAGFIFITTAMTYVISVASAIIDKRSLSLFIANMGDSPQELLANAWDGESLSGLTSVATELRQMINRHVQNHRAYSTLHFFHSGRRRSSIAINIVKLDEALSIALLLFDPVIEKDQRALRPLRNALSTYLDTLDKTFVRAAQEIDIWPDLSALENKHLKVSAEAAVVKERWHELRPRRKLLAGFLYDSGWSWEDVYVRQSADKVGKIAFSR